MQKRKGPILCYSEFRANALVRQTITEDCIYIYIYIYIYMYIYIYIYIAAINALYFVHRAPYGGEDSTLFVIYIYIYIYFYVEHLCAAMPQIKCEYKIGYFFRQIY